MADFTEVEETPKDHAIGVRVKLGGLNSKPEYNDTYGQIVEWDEKNERWKVLLEYDNSKKALKNSNLTIVPVKKKEYKKGIKPGSAPGQGGAGLAKADTSELDKKYSNSRAWILGDDFDRKKAEAIRADRNGAGGVKASGGGGMQRQKSQGGMMAVKVDANAKTHDGGVKPRPMNMMGGGALSPMADLGPHFEPDDVEQVPVNHNMDRSGGVTFSDRDYSIFFRKFDIMYPEATVDGAVLQAKLRNKRVLLDM